MTMPGGWELVIILLVIVLLFGAKKLPDAARSLGRSMRIFKSEVQEMRNDDPQELPAPEQPNSGQAQPTIQQPAPQPENRPDAQPNA